MSLTFERGNPDQPRGHAVLYYRASDQILATYVIVLPLAVDFAKYVPPIMASQVKASGLEEFSAFAIPPIPEEVQNYEQLEELASRRGDDMVYDGEVTADDFLEAAQRVNDAVQEYARLYQQAAEQVGGPLPLDVSAGVYSSELSVDEVMFSLMSDKDRLGEMGKLVGKLQFALEGADTRLASETEQEMRALGRYLPENYQVDRIIQTASQPGENGPQLLQLYLERCYKLADEDYLGLQKVDETIRETQESNG
jgi:hypothetical protein